MTSPTKDFRLIYITDDLNAASIASSAGVDSIMVDLEIDGKVKRQGHLNTVISHHTPQAINHVVEALKETERTEVLVRVNPISGNSAFEIDNIISRGAHRLMLPMFRTADEVSRFIDLVAGRVPVTLLLETKDAYQNFDSILKIDGCYDIHVGLNDLHLEMGLDFMFQLLTNGVVDNIAELCRTTCRNFGIGGVAPLSTNAKLAPSDILAYHASVGSSSAILSRDWRKVVLEPGMCAIEVKKLQNYVRGKPVLNRTALEDTVAAITKTINKKH